MKNPPDTTKPSSTAVTVAEGKRRPVAGWVRGHFDFSPPSDVEALAFDLSSHRRRPVPILLPDLLR